jgi:hypothetical protein
MNVARFIGSYALALFVPIYLELSRRLTLTHRRLGMVTAVTGARTLPRWVALCLIAAGIGFPLAQVGGFAWALAWAYPAACGLWLVSLSWVGVTRS